MCYDQKYSTHSGLIFKSIDIYEHMKIATEPPPHPVRAGQPVKSSEDAILEGRGLTKKFAGFTAVDGIDLRVKRGSIHALIGPNGAGKTTCFNLLTKQLQPNSGSIWFKGQDITNCRPNEVALLGVARSFQISSVFPHMTVLENVRVALQRRRGRSFDFWRSERVLSQYDDEAMHLLTEMDLREFSNKMAGQLSYGRKRALELATTLALDPELMLLDEPTAGMGHDDVFRVIDLVKQASIGRTVLLVEHNLEVLKGLCDAVTVLVRGRIIAQGDYQAVSSNPEVISAYLGESL